MERFPRERTSVIRKGVQPQMAARPILYSHLSCPHDIGCGHSDEEIMDELYNPERVEQRYRALEKKLAEQKMRRAITRSKPIVDVQDEVQTHREAERKKGLDTVEAWANNKKPQEQRGLKTHENSSLERRLEAEKHEAFLAAMRERKQGSKDRRHRKLEALKDLLRAEKKEAMKDYLNF